MMRPFLLAAAAAVLGGAAVLAVAGNPERTKFTPPKAAKPFPVTDVLQMRVPTDPWTPKEPLVQLRGRVVVLQFIGTFYERCETAVPDVNGLHDRLGGRGVTVLSVCAEEERPAVEAWLKKTGSKVPTVIADTPTKEKLFAKEYPFPGMPWAFVIDAHGMAHFSDHPSGIKDADLEPLLDAVTVPPVLPDGFLDVQKDLDAGLWSKARAALLAQVEAKSLDKPGTVWAKAVIRWIETRHKRAPAEAAEQEKAGNFWDAWKLHDDFVRAFDGMGGEEDAKAKAAAIRANPAAKLDLEAGDDLEKAKDVWRAGKVSNARLILQRLSKLKTPIGARAKEMIPYLPAK